MEMPLTEHACSVDPVLLEAQVDACWQRTHLHRRILGKCFYWRDEVDDSESSV